jgi:hypothetical protein
MTEEIIDAEIIDEGIDLVRQNGEVVMSEQHNMNKLYLSGPMTDIENFNHPMFHRVAQEFRNSNFQVCSPAEFFDGDSSRPRKEYMREAFKYLLEADTIVLLPGWEGSKGARIEAAVAQELDLIVVEYIENEEEKTFVGSTLTPIDEEEIEISGTFTPVEE